MHRRGGARSHSGMVSSGWGLNTLRLLWNISRGWTLHHSCSRRQSRRCLGTLSRRVAYGSPGSACAIFGRGTGMIPGPESLPSTCANHGCRLATGTGQTQQVRGRNRHAVKEKCSMRLGRSAGGAVKHATVVRSKRMGGPFLMVLQEDEGSSLVSQRAAGVTFCYWGRIFATVAKILSCTSISPSK